MMTANLFLGAVPILVRLVGRWSVPSSEIAFIRFAMGCMGVAIWLALGFGRLELHERRGLLMRGTFGGLSATFYFYAIQMSSAGKGALLNCTYILWANIFAIAVFRERPPRGFWALLGLASVGLALVLNPSFATTNWGDVFGLLSGFCGGAAVYSLKQLRKNTNSLTIFASFALFGAVFALVPPLATAAGGASAPLWIVPPTAAWLGLLGVGFAGMAGQMFFTYGYGYTSIALGTLMSMSVPVIAAVGGYTFLGEPLTPHFLLGATLILVACGMLQYREAVERKALTGPPSVSSLPMEESDPPAISRG